MTTGEGVTSEPSNVTYSPGYSCRLLGGAVHDHHRSFLPPKTLWHVVRDRALTGRKKDDLISDRANSISLCCPNNTDTSIQWAVASQLLRHTECCVNSE